MTLKTLQLLLKEIKAGKTMFGPEGVTDKDKELFQYKAELLAIADQNGYIQGYYPIYSDNVCDS
ncbi:MAG: hypothetical protein ACR65R_12055 [Methylomicrobium sp.]